MLGEDEQSDCGPPLADDPCRAQALVGVCWRYPDVDDRDIGTGALDQFGFDVVQVLPYAALDTLLRYAGWWVPRPLTDALSFGLDYMPVVRSWGSTCLWVARKR